MITNVIYVITVPQILNQKNVLVVGPQWMRFQTPIEHHDEGEITMARKFPFAIRQVAEILKLKVRYDNQDNGNMDVDCPFCGKESKLNLNATNNLYRCNSCDISGGMLGLYAKVHSISNTDAYQEICEILGCGKSAYTNGGDSASRQVNRAANDAIHQTYAMLLSMLTLAKTHKEQLLSRGLAQEHIDRYAYKSVPAFGQKQFCERLLQSGCILEGVPGFYRDNGMWNVRLKAPGILIPVCGIDGKIAGLQIRLDKPVNSRKYIWLSSPDMDGGASSGAPIHFIGDPAAKRIFITDGTLKGTVAHILSRHTFVCLPGVKILGGLDELLLCLKANGTTEAVEAFDLNKLTNEQAEASALNLRKKLFEHGLRVTSAVWGDESCGSVDDYFLHRTKTSKNHVYNVDISAAEAV